MKTKIEKVFMFTLSFLYAMAVLLFIFSTIRML